MTFSDRQRRPVLCNYLFYFVFVSAALAVNNLALSKERIDTAIPETFTANAQGSRWSALEQCKRLLSHRNNLAHRNSNHAIQQAELSVQATENKQLNCILILSDHYLHEGEYDKGAALLAQAISSPEHKYNSGKLHLMQRLTHFYLRLEYVEEAKQATEQLLSSLTPNSPSVFKALALLYSAQVSYLQSNHSDAIKKAAEAKQAFNGISAPQLAIPIAMNHYRLMLDISRALPSADLSIESELTDLSIRINKTQSNKLQCSWLISLGGFAVQSLKDEASSQAETIARKSYQRALNLAQQQELTKCHSSALGGMGQLEEINGNLAAAVKLGNEATSYAQQIGARDLLYQWQWQTGRALKQLGDRTGAIDHYQQAVINLKSIRTQLVRKSRQGYRQLVGPVYYELADLLLYQSKNQPAEEQQLLLKDVRNTIESLKIAEIEDYFHSECVVFKDNTLIGQIDPDAAVLYPIIMPDRIELLLSLKGRFLHFTSQVPRTQLVEQIYAYRLNLESYIVDDDYLSRAQQLYQWLVAPIEPVLRESNIKTLVFVPDGALRTLPISALHTGDDFLIQKYAIVTSLGMTLTNPAAISPAKVKILANGLSQSVQGYPSLPNVDNELGNISQLFPATINLDENFQLESTQAAIAEGDFSIIHIATHGEFNRDHRKSFLLTYDRKLTMDHLQRSIDLRRFRKNPLELLVLSACQTAAGDDRAALGLAGVALKSGARSALATLWFISDEATSALISEFYTQLKQSGITKAEALRQAQRHLIQDPLLSHPSFWAPFLLIGNWL